jgi:hypothetical protein
MSGRPCPNEKGLCFFPRPSEREWTRRKNVIVWVRYHDTKIGRWELPSSPGHRRIEGYQTRRGDHGVDVEIVTKTEAKHLMR